MASSHGALSTSDNSGQIVEAYWKRRWQHNFYYYYYVEILDVEKATDWGHLVDPLVNSGAIG